LTIVFMPDSMRKIGAHDATSASTCAVPSITVSNTTPSSLTGAVRGVACRCPQMTSPPL
jgi:hypothetical protein